MSLLSKTAEVITSTGVKFASKTAKGAKKLITPVGDLATTTGKKVPRTAISGGRTEIKFAESAQGVGKVPAPKFIQQAAAGVRTIGSSVGLVGVGGLTLAGASLYGYDKYLDINARTSANRQREQTRGQDSADFDLWKKMVDSGFLNPQGSDTLSNFDGTPTSMPSYSSRNGETGPSEKSSNVLPLVLLGAAGVGVYLFMKRKKHGQRK